MIDKSEEYKNAEQGRRLIFKAELDDTLGVVVTCHSDHLPTLCLISKQLDYHITELMAVSKVKNERIAKPKIIHEPGNILNRLRGGKG